MATVCAEITSVNGGSKWPESSLLDEAVLKKIHNKYSLKEHLINKMALIPTYLIFVLMLIEP